MEDRIEKLLRKIPSVEKVLTRREIEPYIDRYSRKFVKEICKRLLREIRRDIIGGRRKGFFLTQLDTELCEHLEKDNQNIRRVINATGVILSTNLGRAPLSENIVDSIRGILTGYSNLEYDLEKGKRGKRYDHLIGLLKELTGAEDALVVNNNAGAVLLCLDTFAKDKEVVVSRGQLIEIGGSFRLPDVLKKSGAKLVEVGTTNRTYIDDYKNAITKDTRMLLLIHRSNFKMVGFTADPTIEEIVSLGKEKGLITMMDLGSGLVAKLKGFENEHTSQGILKKKIDIVSFSGDKLLGGPQAGIILGTNKEIIEKIKHNALLRALRVGKFTISSLEVILRMYLYSDNPIKDIPGLSMFYLTKGELKKRASRLKEEISKVTEGLIRLQVKQGFSEMGGGSLPGEFLPTYLVVMKHKKMSESKFSKLLRENIPPVIVRIENERVVMDPRTIFPEEFKEIKQAVKKICETEKILEPGNGIH